MKKSLAAIAGGLALVALAGCGDLAPDLPTGDEQQIGRPATLGSPDSSSSLGNPGATPAQAVPGER